jgi:hypothetical protein
MNLKGIHHPITCVKLHWTSCQNGKHIDMHANIISVEMAKLVAQRLWPPH